MYTERYIKRKNERLYPYILQDTVRILKSRLVQREEGKEGKSMDQKTRGRAKDFQVTPETRTHVVGWNASKCFPAKGREKGSIMALGRPAYEHQPTNTGVKASTDPEETVNNDI